MMPLLWQQALANPRKSFLEPRPRLRLRPSLHHQLEQAWVVMADMRVTLPLRQMPFPQVLLHRVNVEQPFLLCPD